MASGGSLDDSVFTCFYEQKPTKSALYSETHIEIILNYLNICVG